MDQLKFVTIIKQFPQIWERNHPNFRDKDAKDRAWEIIGTKMGSTGETCKETFKSVREKYVREREKSIQHGKNYREWELLKELAFLDPNIVPRKQSTNNDEDMQKAEEFCSQINLETSIGSINQMDFDKALIELVKKTTPIWDRNCNTYPNKQLKNQLWQNIATKLKKDTTSCMLRWKALREKYIRQKTKYLQEGEVKWELLDDMNFLDKVIHYRKKQIDDMNSKKLICDSNDNINNMYPLMQKQNDLIQESNSNFSQISQSSRDDIVNDSSNDYPAIIKEEITVLQKADSSYSEGCNVASRKRSISVNSEAHSEKKSKNETSEVSEKTPEQLFGDLIAVMLSKKPEKYRNLYMIEIMQVLSK